MELAREMEYVWRKLERWIRYGASPEDGIGIEQME